LRDFCQATSRGGEASDILTCRLPIHKHQSAEPLLFALFAASKLLSQICVRSLIQRHIFILYLVADTLVYGCLPNSWARLPSPYDRNLATCITSSRDFSVTLRTQLGTIAIHSSSPLLLSPKCDLPPPRNSKNYLVHGPRHERTGTATNQRSVQASLVRASSHRVTQTHHLSQRHIPSMLTGQFPLSANGPVATRPSHPVIQ